MKYLFLSILISWGTVAQIDTRYEPNADYPHGRLNPKAPKEVADWDALIGTCDCDSDIRNPDGSWAETTKMVWKWKYIMNGTAVQDETWLPNGRHAGSIRQFIADSSKWYVHFYSDPGATPALPAWEGGMRGDSLVLYRDQKAPNGMDGMYRITFSDMNTDGFNWIGEWVDTTENIVYPTWKISCKKRKPEAVKEQILQNVKAFSEAYMREDTEALVNMYTEDGKLFPGGSNILEGREALMKFWKFREGVSNLHHKITPTEIKIIDNYAYDFGYYEGSTSNAEGKKTDFKGKYVVVWRKENDNWKIYLDIWNRI